MTTITLPANINGITEVGIAANVDHFDDTRFQLTVRMAAAAGAPVAPTAVQVRANAVVNEWAALADGVSRAAFWGSDAQIVGTSAASANDIRGAITDWPADAVAAEGQNVITATVATDAVTNWDAWVGASAHMRNHLDVDLTATLEANEPPVTTPAARKLWQGLVAYVVSNEWTIADPAAASGMIRYAGPEEPMAANRTAVDINEIGFTDPQDAANILVATKINWWLQNHHVGQKEGVIEGFAGKIAAIQELTSEANIAQNREVRKVLWSIGKMVSTRGILIALGIDSIHYVNGSNTGSVAGNDYARCGDYNITASDDVALRIAANPAGTAGLYTHFAIASRARHSVYCVAIPPLTTLGWDRENNNFTGPVADRVAAIGNNAARYHMGSHFLTGHPRLGSDVWTEEERANLAAFIHAIAPGSTLSKASVILPQSEVSGNITYTTLTSLRVALTANLNDRAGLLMASRITGGNASGGMALQFNRITDGDVEAVAAQMQAYDAGEVSEDEDVPARGAGRNPAMERNAERAARRIARSQAIAILNQASGP